MVSPEGRVGLGALHVLVDPLVIAGSVGEGVDTRLLDREPFSHGHLVTN